MPPSPYSLPMADEASAQARGNEMLPGGHLRAAHDDRNRVVELLRVAAGDGRRTLEELDQRVGAALTARTYGELAALVSDLPAAPASPAGAPEDKPKDLVRIDCHTASTRRQGPWMVPRRMQVQVTGGSVTLDFTEAVTWWPSLQLDVAVRGGSLRLVTKPGILVNTDDLEVQASSVRVRAPWDRGVPVRFRIDVAGTAASGSVKTCPPRRTLWQPLLPPAPRPWWGGRVRTIPDRNCFAAIVFVACASTPWRLLPAHELGCGSPATVWRRLGQWAKAAVFEQLHLEILDRLGLPGRLDWPRASLDSASVRAKRGGTTLAQIPSIVASQGPSCTSSAKAAGCR
jgi:transposase